MRPLGQIVFGWILACAVPATVFAGPTEALPNADSPKTEPLPAGSPTANADSAVDGSDEPTTPATSAPIPKREQTLFQPHPVKRGEIRFRPGRGLELRSADRQFSLTTSLRAQFRWALTRTTNPDDISHRLTIPIGRLIFFGNAFGEKTRYVVQIGVAPGDVGFGTSNGSTPLLDWFVDFAQLRDLTVRVGQTLLPYGRLAAIAELQFVTFSRPLLEFFLDRDIGIQVLSRDLGGWGRVRYQAGVFIGEGRDAIQATNAELAYVSRIEILPFGLFNDTAQGDFERTTRVRVSLGGSYAFVDGATGDKGNRGSPPIDGGTTDIHQVSGDAVFKLAGVSVAGEFYMRRGERKFGNATVIEDGSNLDTPAPRDAPRNGSGYRVQAGYLIPRVPIEVSTRVSEIIPTGNTSLTAAREIGGGISYYIARHPLKLQLNYFRVTHADQKSAADEVLLQLQFTL